MAAQRFSVRAWLKAIDCSEYEPNLSLCHSMTHVIKEKPKERNWLETSKEFKKRNGTKVHRIIKVFRDNNIGLLLHWCSVFVPG